MKILVLRASNSKNYGSLMMVANYISRHKEKYPEASYIVDNIESDGLERIKIASNVNDIDSFLSLDVKLRPDCRNDHQLVKLFKYFSFARNFGAMIESLGINKVVFLGGDDFSEYYTLRSVVIELIKIRSMASNKIEVLMLGQTIGPFYSWRKKFAASCLSKTSIFTRDASCANYLRDELGLDNVRESADLAYITLPNQNDDKTKNQADTLLNGFNNYELIVTSGLWRSYCSSYESYLNFWVEYINGRIEKGSKVLLLSHVLSDTSSDNKIILDLNDRLAGHSRLMCITDIIQPVVAREIISRSKFTLSGRMHACVSSLQTGVPTIPLSYSIKFKGVIGELPLKNNIIECSDENMWKTPNVLIEKIEKEIDKISADGFGINVDISQAISTLEPKVLEQIS